MAPRELLHGDVIAGAYEIVRRLDECDPSPVYVVRHLLADGDLWALELLPPHVIDGPRGRERFEALALALPRLGHRHIARVAQAGIHEGLPWVVRALHPGQHLGKVVSQRGFLWHKEAADIIAQLGEALGAAADRGMSHGELRPELVYLASQWNGRAPPIVKVLDLGVAQLAADAALGVPDLDLLTLERVRWIAPERARGEPGASAAADVWTLGLLGFLMVTGKPYWKGESVDVVLHEVLSAPLPPATERARELGFTWSETPRGFDAWFAGCVARDPKARFRDGRCAASVLGGGAGLVEVVEAFTSSVPEDVSSDDDFRGALEPPEASPERDATDADGSGGYRRSARPSPVDDTLHGNPEVERAAPVPAWLLPLAQVLEQGSQGTESVYRDVIRPRVWDDEDTPRPVVTAVPRAVPASHDCLVAIRTGEPGLLGKRFVLGDNPTRVGRHAGNHIVLDDDSISRWHAHFELRAGRWFVVDCCSANGTYLNDERISRNVGLENGDHIKIGSTVFKLLSGGDIEARYRDEIYRMTISDDLTQIHNKRYLDEALVVEIRRARRHERDLAMLFFDIDHLERVNQAHGRLAGDFVLKEVARTVQAGIRRDDFFARYGGDELVLLLPETSLAGAVALAETLRKKVSEHLFVFKADTIRITISVGAALLQDSDRMANDLVQRADERLRVAKDARREGAP